MQAINTARRSIDHVKKRDLLTAFLRELLEVPTRTMQALNTANRSIIHVKKGNLLTWVGRRSCMKEDLMQYRGGNFAGHTILMTEKKQCICFSGDLSNANDPNTNMNTLYEHIRNKNRKWLENWNLPVSITVSPLDKCKNLAYALEANLDVYVTPLYYNESKLEAMIHDDIFLKGFRYAWNVDIAKGHINCNTFLQAWGVSYSIPLIKKQSNFHNLLIKRYNAQRLLNYKGLTKEYYTFFEQYKNLFE